MSKTQVMMLKIYRNIAKRRGWSKYKRIKKDFQYKWWEICKRRLYNRAYWKLINGGALITELDNHWRLLVKKGGYYKLK